MSLQDSFYAQKKTRELFVTYQNAMIGQDYDKALSLITRIARIARFRALDVNNTLLTVLLSMERHNELYKYTCSFLDMAIKEDDIASVLYYYQILATITYEDLLEKMNAKKRYVHDFLRTRADSLRDQYCHTALRGRPKKRLHVAHMIGLVTSGHAPSKMLFNELKYVDRSKFDISVYCVEWAANWYYNRSVGDEYQSLNPQVFDVLNDEYGINAYVSDISQDFFKRTVSICNSLIFQDVDVLIVHASDAEAITLLTVLMKSVPKVVNVVHSFPIVLDTIDAYIHPHEVNVMHSSKVPQFYVPITSDVQDESSDVLENSSSVLLKKIGGLKEAHTISATFGNLFKMDNSQFIKTISSMLKKDTNLVHLIVGKGDSDKIFDLFTKEGVADRIIMCGFQKNIKPFIELTDVYCATFPYPGCLCELECMALGKPVVSMAWDKGHHYNSGASVVAHELCVAQKQDYSAYIDIALRFVHDKNLRVQVGNDLKKRFSDWYAPQVRAQNLTTVYEEIALQTKVNV